MTAVSLNEVVPGLSVRLDTGLLRQLGASDTNAAPGPPDRAVQGPHQFLIVEIDIHGGKCLAVPLFSTPANGNVALVASKMTGTLPAWQNGQYHYSVYQHWWIPLNDVVAASASEFTHSGDRSMYAVADPGELAGIAASQSRNRYGFRKA